MNWGMDYGPLPYRLQADYDRGREVRSFTAAVLENDRLIATFLPECGGRLWSLFHKPTNRELLYVNPVFQPGNLALLFAALLALVVLLFALAQRRFQRARLL